MIDHSSAEVSENRIQPWEYGLVLVILLTMGVIAFLSASRESITMDEIVHIPAGVSYLQQHDARMNPEHPPLMKVLSALPLVVGGIRLDYSLPHWTQTKDALFGEEAFSSIGPTSSRWIMLARVPMIGIMLALGFTIFWMARRLAGVGGGFLALFIFATTPFFYAYGPLVHTDIGIALFALLATWTFVSVWFKPDWPHAVRFGLCLTGALLTKFTAGLLMPCFVLLALSFLLRPGAAAPRFWRSAWFSTIGVGISAVFVYCTYFFLFWNNNTAGVLAYRFEHSVAPIPVMKKVALFLQAHPDIQHLVSPPIIYFLGVGHTLHALPRTSYLLGRTYAHGTAVYFPALFAYKMPLAYLFLAALLVVLTIAYLLRARSKTGEEVQAYPNHLRGLVLLFVLFTAASLTSPLNIGIRHISVPIATLTVLLALAVPLASAIFNSAARKIALALMVLAVFGNISALAAGYPYYIPYFNTLVGHHPKFDVAIDSNLDWGQELIQLRDFQQQHPSEKFGFDVKGSIPSVYLPGATAFDCETGPPPGVDWAAIGSTRFVSQPELVHLAADPKFQCRNYFQYPYVVDAGGAVYIFHVSGNSK